MDTQAWWHGATPHSNIRDGKVNEALFEAKLGEAIQDRGPDEYRLAELFFQKTFFTAGLRSLLTDILHTLSDRRSANVIVNLKTSFGGGKTHTELAVYHLFAHPAESMRVPQVRELVHDAGLDVPPLCRIAVLPGTNLSPTGRMTDDGLTILTLWGEMAYRLGGAETFAMLADEDARLVSPGEDKLRQVLASVGPSLILLDETLHYVDKASNIAAGNEDLAKQTVAFLRELTAVIDSVGDSMLIVSLTASRTDQLSNDATEWLERMEHHINRLAHACTPIEGTEIHEVVRRRLFDAVDENVAVATADRYHRLYKNLADLPGQYTQTAYRDLIRRSYPFHPELITVIYERWGSKPTFQLTRSTLRFLALVLQDLWQRRETAAPDLIQMGHVSAANSTIRAMIRDIAGDAQWESVIGSDIAAPAVSAKVSPSKAEEIDDERHDGLGLAQALATTILLYSLGGGEHPEATRHEIRLACARHGVEEATWDDLLDKFRRRLFYLYYDEAKYQFRKEPNVTSLHHTYRVNISGSSEIDAYVNKTMRDKALGSDSVSQSFAHVVYLPAGDLMRDDDSLKLVVLGFEHPLVDGQPPEDTRQVMMKVLEYHGQVLRQHRNTLVFCAPDKALVARARELAADYLSWRKIQHNPADWDRIGGQQALVKDQMNETEGAALQAITNAYNYALVPSAAEGGARLTLEPVPLGTYGPGKYVTPMVWESLTDKIAHSQWLLKELTPETFLERYDREAWPKSEKTVTTAQLWNRFTTQVGLPILVREQVLLDMLRQGAYEGQLAIGLLVEAQGPRDQRDSYSHLYFKESMPSNAPLIGERWIVMRPAAYGEIAEQPEQVTAEDIVAAVETLRGGSQTAVSANGLYQFIASKHPHGIDNTSYVAAVQQTLREHQLAYKEEGQTKTEIDVEDPRALPGEFFKEVVAGPPPTDGRTIVVRGTIDPVKELGALYNSVIKALTSQNPASFTMELTVRAQFNVDPGGGLDASLDDAFDNNAFPGLRREESKGG